MSSIDNQVSEIKKSPQFIRKNPMSDKFSSKCFHHVEIYCGDATSTYKRFMLGLGMNPSVKSDLSTGNNVHASYGLESSNLRMLFTAPYISSPVHNDSSEILPGFSRDIANSFTNKHGLGVRAVAIEVEDVKNAYEILIQNGAVSNLFPTKIIDSNGRGYAYIAEIFLYGDVLLRLLNLEHFTGKFLPNFQDVNDSLPVNPWITPASVTEGVTESGVTE
eukprot:gene58380-77896_t